MFLSLNVNLPDQIQDQNIIVTMTPLEPDRYIGGAWNRKKSHFLLFYINDKSILFVNRSVLLTFLTDL